MLIEIQHLPATNDNFLDLFCSVECYKASVRLLEHRIIVSDRQQYRSLLFCSVNHIGLEQNHSFHHESILCLYCEDCE